METKEIAEEKVDRLHLLAGNLLKNKMPDHQIVDALLREGVEESYALVIIENVKSDIEAKKEFWRLVLLGSTLILAGVTISYYSYKIAEHAHFMFYVFWGMVALGIIIIVRAFILYR